MTHYSGIGIGSGITPFLLESESESRNVDWNRIRSGIKEFLLESKLESESEILKNAGIGIKTCPES